MPNASLPRRRILVSMAGLGATGLLAACGESSPGESSQPAQQITPEPETSQASSETTANTSSDASDKASIANAQAGGAQLGTKRGTGTDGDAGELLLLSNDSPHITTIDILTEEIARTADLEGFTTWAWTVSYTHLTLPTNREV